MYYKPPWIDSNCPPEQLGKSFQDVFTAVKERFPEHAVHFADIVAVVGKETVDGIHPNLKGHELLAEQMAKVFHETDLWGSG